jgi:hypothetical protein
MRRLKRLLKALGLHAIRDAFRLFAGWRHFRRTGVTPPAAHQGLVSLFCLTGGASNDLLHRSVARRRPSLPVHGGGVLAIDETQLGEIARRLDERGYYVFAQRLPEELCDRLLAFALTEPAVVKIGQEPVSVPYDRQHPRGARYDFTESTLLQSEAVQELMADPGILAVSQAYLGCAPILDFAAMWWHTSWSQTPDAEAGQLFHFDMDRIKWLKFFFYVTDVGPENGPHTFVAGSHRTKGIPRSILAKGQNRIEDGEVLRSYASEDVVELCGPRGTVIAEDTRGLHKGKHVQSGDRLVFQLELTDSLFGATYAELSQTFVPGPLLDRMARAFPGVYARFVAQPS